MSATVAQVVEAAWARFRRSSGGALLQRSLTLRSSYRAAIGLSHLPAEVVLPGAIPWNLLARAEATARGEAVGPTLSREGTVLAQSVATWAAYRDSKTLYAIDPLLAEALAHTPWPEHVPTAALRLSSRCPVLALPWEETSVHIAPYYDLLTGQEASGQLELRLGRLAEDRWETESVLHLSGEDLGTCVRAAGARVEREGGPAGLFQSDLAGLALTVLLYLGGEPDLVRLVPPRGEAGSRPPDAPPRPGSLAGSAGPHAVCGGDGLPGGHRAVGDRAARSGLPAGRSDRSPPCAAGPCPPLLDRARAHGPPCSLPPAHSSQGRPHAGRSATADREPCPLMRQGCETSPFMRVRFPPPALKW
ncbi:MAG: hypothetical protein HY713_07150, partial [candidate division NC10 bacterium]|nr:hypothetical protein [candidate division NC10 bacterium]